MNHRRSRAYLTLLLAVALVLPSAVPAAAATRDDANKHRQAAEDARKKAAEADALADKLAVEAAALDKRIDALQAEADALEPQLDEAEKRTDTLAAEVNAIKADVASAQREIDRTQADYEKQQALLADRVESTYRQGDWFYLDVLLGSQDFSDLIARTELVNRVIEANTRAAASLADTTRRLEAAKGKLKRSLKAVDLKRREAAVVEGRLRDLQDQRQGKVDAQAALYRQKSEMMSENRKNAARLRALAESEERESARIESELSARGGSGQFSGSMTWPTPGFTRVTSNYGWRICPFHGREFHPGIDIGRKGDGTPIDGAAIVATADGEVIYAGYRGGYGNTVLIDHGNGVVTLYAHQRSGGIKVGVGEKVKKGERIGTVGSTGYSTGPHLHFEVRVNGSAKNPMSYL